MDADGLAQPRLLLAYAAATAALAWLAFALVERHTRRRWVGVESRRVAARGPYRSGELPFAAYGRSPPAVRAACFGSLFFGIASVPALLAALSAVPLHGFALLLVPAVGVAIGTIHCGVLLMRRAPEAARAVRTLAEVSIVLTCTLLPLSVLHFLEGLTEAKPGGLGPSIVAFVFAQASLAECVVMLLALRKHRAAFT